MARPREFEPDMALTDMMNIFWENGYEATSMADIEAATSLNKQSLYRVYGGKRAMYLAALRHYKMTIVVEALEDLAAPGTAAAKVERLFAGLLTAAAKGDRRGCFVCNASIDQAQVDAETKDIVTTGSAQIEKSLRAALALTSPYDKDHRLRKKTAQKILATYMGLRILVSAGSPIDMLKSISQQTISDI